MIKKRFFFLQNELKFQLEYCLDSKTKIKPIKMSLWCDKHRPKTLAALDYHKEQAEQLKKLVNNEKKKKQTSQLVNKQNEH